MKKHSDRSVTRKKVRKEWMKILSKGERLYIKDKGKVSFRNIAVYLKVSPLSFAKKWNNLRGQSIAEYKKQFKESQRIKSLHIKEEESIKRRNAKVNKVTKPKESDDLKNQASENGLDPDLYPELWKEICKRLKNKLYSMRGNAANVANFSQDSSVPFVQISFAELLQIFLGVATSSFPKLNKKDALLKVLKDGRNFMLVRKNTALPYTKDNTVVMSSKKLGAIFGKRFGINTPHQKRKGIKPR
jgi:23S rRNA pseudoU1915 N3-methylase RlmH